MTEGFPEDENAGCPMASNKRLLSDVQYTVTRGTCQNRRMYFYLQNFILHILSVLPQVIEIRKPGCTISFIPPPLPLPLRFVSGVKSYGENLEFIAPPPAF